MIYCHGFHVKSIILKTINHVCRLNFKYQADVIIIKVEIYIADNYLLYEALLSDEMESIGKLENRVCEIVSDIVDAVTLAKMKVGRL